GCAAGPAAALENMRIIEDERLLDNTQVMGEYLMGRLKELMHKHRIVGDVRGKGLFCGLELVADRTTKEPVQETVVQAIVAHCKANGVLIGATNRSFDTYNNTLCLSPALICTETDLDTIVGAIDSAIAHACSN
ncbi:MAG: aminotransferase class III-fold pyridoxal phosphate-dependent enzyme, partial [Pseudomonadota bacterium]